MAELIIDQLSVSYGKVQVLENVQFRVASGEVVGLIGGNGAGKSTTLRAVSGVIQRSSGSVTVDSVTVRARAESASRAGISHVPEGRRLFANLTVDQNLRLGALAAGHDLKRADFERFYTHFPACKELGGRRAAALSGGEQQMIAILRGLAAKPKFLMVDEVCLGLAPIVVDNLVESMIQVAAEFSLGLLLVDQNVTMLKKTCNRIYILHNGKTKEMSGTDEDLRSVYFD